MIKKLFVNFILIFYYAFVSTMLLCGTVKFLHDSADLHTMVRVITTIVYIVISLISIVALVVCFKNTLEKIEELNIKNNNDNSSDDAIDDGGVEFDLYEE